MLQRCAVFVGVFKDNDKEGFENYTLFNACYSAGCAVFVGVFKDNDKEGRKWARAAKNCLFVQLSSAFFALKLLLCNNNTSPISKDAVGRAVLNCTENFLGKTFVKYDSGGCNFFPS